jgi:two-component system chemotaxis response regulator CheB
MSTQRRDVVVIGGSAGAVEVLSKILSQLPVNLGAAVAVTLHRQPTFASSLAKVFARSSSLPVVEPADGDAFVPGRVYLAPQDQHMLIAGRVIRLDRGPRQHHTRPAIDPMFVSAADSYGGRVIGALLTGNLSDGVSGLIRVKDRGGLSLVQDPSEALFPSMPRNALIYDGVDLVLQSEILASVLARLVQGESVHALVRTIGVRTPQPEDQRSRRWVARGHRLP